MRQRGQPSSPQKWSWVMRSVSHTAASVTASIAARKGMWMLTSTVRSTSFDNIMRTGSSAGNRPRACAAMRCSSSVWPGTSTPAAASAALCRGAVTMALTSPRSAAWAAAMTASAAARPATALTSPKRGSAGIDTTGHTGMHRGGTRPACAGPSSTAIGSSPPPTCAARRITATSPTTTQRDDHSGQRRNTSATISGPMPAASPMVMAMGASPPSADKRGASIRRDCRCR